METLKFYATRTFGVMLIGLGLWLGWGVVSIVIGEPRAAMAMGGMALMALLSGAVCLMVKKGEKLD